MRVKFGPWMPDQPDLDSGGLEECVNCLPSEAGYMAIRENVTLSGSSSAPRRVTSSVVYQRPSSGAQPIRMIVGLTSNADLSSEFLEYQFSATSSMSGTTISRSQITGSASASVFGGINWSFAVFGDNVIASNGVGAMRIRNGTGNFRKMSASASAPLARVVAAVRDFVFAGNIGNTGNRVQWSQINNAERWTPSARNQSDFQDLPDCGNVVGIAGGDFASIITELSVWRATYVGSPIIFRFDEVVKNVKCIAERSIARYENLTFFVAEQGVQLFDGAQCIPIGAGFIDRYILDTVSGTAEDDRIVGAIDPLNRAYVLSLTGRQELLFYNFVTRSWGRIAKPHHFITQSIKLHSPRSLRGLGPLGSRLGIGMFTDDTTDANYTEFISDSYMTATFATGEAQPFTDHRAFVRGIRPLIQGDSNTSVSVEIGRRNQLTESVSYTSAVNVNANGLAPVRADARYLRARVKVTGGFERAIGFDIDAVRSGKR